MLADMGFDQIAIGGIQTFGRWHENPAVQRRVVGLYEMALAPYQVRSEKVADLGADQFLCHGLLFTFGGGLDPEVNLIAGQHFFHFFRAQEKRLIVIGVYETKTATTGTYTAGEAGNAVADFFFQRLKLGKGVFIEHPQKP